MSVLIAFLVSASVAMGLALGAVLLLRSTLGELLVELCGRPSRARFWLAFVSVSIVLTALFGMLLSFPLQESRWGDYPQWPAVLGALRMSLFFLLASLGALAVVLLVGIRNHERRQRLLLRSSSPASATELEPAPS